MNITIVNKTQEKISQKRLHYALEMILSFLKSKKIRNKKWLLQKKEIVFIFLGKNEMQKINFKYRKKNKPTDVLSFQSGDKLTLGELVFCFSVLKKQAKEQGHSIHQELQYMMIHGLLHSLGYDHEVSKSEEKIMFRIQNLCFEQVCHLPKSF